MMAFLRRNDASGFRALVRAKKTEISATDESAFFDNAPKRWIKSFLRYQMPSVESEKRMLIQPDTDLIEFSVEQWGLHPETVRWAFTDASDDVAERIIPLLPYADSDTEELMIRKNNTYLFKMWLKKFHTLQEENERLVHEIQAYEHLKGIYIDYRLGN